MRMERKSAAGPLVSGFSAEGFRVDEGVYRALLLTPERAEGWTPPALSQLDAAALAPLLQLSPAPEFILLGTGARLVQPAPALARALGAQRIGLEVMDSRAAARAWGVLRAEDRWIAAALYPIGI
jgi:uncharacterized protein